MCSAFSYLFVKILSFSNLQMDNGNVDDTNGCTNPGGHYRIIDEEIGVVCKYCPAVFTEMRHLFPKFVSR